MSGVGKWGQRIGAWEKETGKRMKAGKLDFWLYVSKLGSVPPLRMSLGACGAALVCTSWGKISNLLEGSKV